MYVGMIWKRIRAFCLPLNEKSKKENEKIVYKIAVLDHTFTSTPTIKSKIVEGTQ